MENLRGILAAAGFNFKKSLGQNFISDENLLSSIVRLADVESSDTVVEIGCGAGTLTRALSRSCGRVVAFEVDRQLQPVLAVTLSGCDNTEVVFCDFLKTDIEELERNLGEYKVVANLPYYVTTPVIMRIFEKAEKCKSITVMVQEEVADRLAARENTPDYGAITAVLALKYSAEVVKKVPRAMFMPQPNVDSAVVKLTARKPLEVKSEKCYLATVHAAFSSRRKTLENNIIKSFGLTRSQAQQALSAAGVPAGARGETLSPEKFAELSDRLYGLIEL